jgi:hypothetical protein
MHVVAVGLWLAETERVKSVDLRLYDTRMPKADGTASACARSRPNTCDEDLRSGEILGKETTPTHEAM